MLLGIHHIGIAVKNPEGIFAVFSNHRMPFANSSHLSHVASQTRATELEAGIPWSYADVLDYILFPIALSRP